MRAPRLLRSYAAAPNGDLTGPQSGEAGSDATNAWWTKYLMGGPDVNPELTGRNKFFVYDEMRKTDASVKSMLLFLKLPIRSAVWGLDPRAADTRSEPDALSILIRDFVAQNLGLAHHDGWLDFSWDETVQTALTMLEMGCSWEEMVWADVRQWNDADGDTHLVRPLSRLAPRLPQTVNWVEYDKGRVVELVQTLPGTDPIPGDKLVHMVWEREGVNWEGVSMLRPAWGPWALKKQLMVNAGIGWDRYALGTPMIYHPPTEEGVETAQQMGRNMRAHEHGYLHSPKPQGMAKDEADYVVELLNGSQTLADPTHLLTFYSEQIAEAGLQQFVRQGLGRTGARATAEVQVDPYFLALQSIAEYIRLQRSRQVIRKLVAVNFGEEAADTRLPILSVSKLRSRNLEVVANAVALFEQAGLTFTDRGAVDDVRELLGFPELPEGLEDAGIPRDQLLGLLRQVGVDSGTFAAIVNALPPELGLARNRPAEGSGLPVAAHA